MRDEFNRRWQETRGQVQGLEGTIISLRTDLDTAQKDTEYWMGRTFEYEDKAKKAEESSAGLSAELTRERSDHVAELAARELAYADRLGRVSGENKGREDELRAQITQLSSGPTQDALNAVTRQREDYKTQFDALLPSVTQNAAYKTLLLGLAERPEFTPEFRDTLRKAVEMIEKPAPPPSGGSS